MNLVDYETKLLSICAQLKSYLGDNWLRIPRPSDRNRRTGYNLFYQEHCQQYSSAGLDQKDVTRKIAERWRSLSPELKQVSYQEYLLIIEGIFYKSPKLLQHLKTPENCMRMRRPNLFRNKKCCVDYSKSEHFLAFVKVIKKHRNRLK